LVLATVLGITTAISVIPSQATRKAQGARCSASMMGISIETEMSLFLCQAQTIQARGHAR
jgi:hypothetical protein